MSHILLIAPTIQQKNVNDPHDDGDGMHVVDDGIVAIEVSTGIALIMERSDWEEYQHNAPRKLKIDLRKYQIRLFKTHSSYNRYTGVSMTITGRFDRNKNEIITIKMTKDDAKLVDQLLRRL